MDRGGRTDLDNLTLLCSHHHRLIHNGGFDLRKDASGSLTFYRPDGTVVDPHPRVPETSGPDLLQRNRRRGHVIDADTCGPLSGDPMDHDLAVAGLLDTERLYGRG